MEQPQDIQHRNHNHEARQGGRRRAPDPGWSQGQRAGNPGEKRAAAETTGPWKWQRVTEVHGRRAPEEEQAKKDAAKKSGHGGDKSSSLLSSRSPPASSVFVKPIEPPERTPDKMCPDEIYHPDRIRHYLRPQDGALENNGLMMNARPVFDPLWLRFDGVESLAALANDPVQMMENLKTFPEVFTNPEAVCPGQYGWYRQQQQSMQEQENISARGKEDQEAAKEEGFPAGPEDFFMGAYTYHWHNSWLCWLSLRAGWDACARPIMNSWRASVRTCTGSGSSEET